MEWSENFAAAVAAAPPNRTAPYDLAGGFHSGQYPESLPGNIALTWPDLRYAATVGHSSPLQAAGIQQYLTTAVATAPPDNIAVLPHGRGGLHREPAATQTSQVRLCSDA